MKVLSNRLSKKERERVYELSSSNNELCSQQKGDPEIASLLDNVFSEEEIKNVRVGYFVKKWCTNEKMATRRYSRK